MKVLVRQGSLTDGGELVLVNASNTAVSLGSGVSGAIRAACGRGFQSHVHDELRRRRPGVSLEPGEVLVTDAGEHPRAKWVAHVAVMDYRDGSGGSAAPDAARIETGCKNLWRAVAAIPAGALSLAMVALGAGVGGLGVRVPTEIACDTLRAAPPPNLATIVFYGYTRAEYEAVREVVSARFDLA